MNFTENLRERDRQREKWSKGQTARVKRTECKKEGKKGERARKRCKMR